MISDPVSTWCLCIYALLWSTGFKYQSYKFYILSAITTTIHLQFEKYLHLSIMINLSTFTMLYKLALKCNVPTTEEA